MVPYPRENQLNSIVLYCIATKMARKREVKVSRVCLTRTCWKLTGRGLEDPRPQLNQRPSSYELTACVIGGSQENSFKYLIMVVVAGKSHFQLWTEETACVIGWAGGSRRVQQLKTTLLPLLLANNWVDESFATSRIINQFTIYFKIFMIFGDRKRGFTSWLYKLLCCNTTFEWRYNR